MDYRRDIDGLRAIAVLAVVAYHVSPNQGVTGGFVGVDVFFVISGYLITGLLVAQLQQNRFSFGQFYLRRLRRLYPAALASICVVACVAPWVLTPSGLHEFWGSVVYSLSSLSNLYFWKHTSYFGADASTRPLLHMWSLGVEEQFYLFWPLLIAGAAKIKRINIRFVILAMCLALGLISFMGAQRTLQSSVEGAFFLPHLRAWEFAVGAVAWAVRGQGRQDRRLASLLYVSGVATIAWSCVAYDETTPFPGWGALLPCCGTACVLLASTESPLSRILDNPVLVGVGRISYSVYLVHWPLLVLWSLHLNRPLSGVEMSGAFAGSLLLGYLSWRFVEESVRRPRPGSVVASSTSFLGLCFVSTLALLVLAASFWQVPPSSVVANARKNDELSVRDRRMLQYLDVQTESSALLTQRGGCYAVGGMRFDPKKCLLQSKTDKPSVLLVGDSLAANLFAGIDAYWSGRVHVDLAASPSCRPVPRASNGRTACKSRNEVIFGTADLSLYDVILLQSNFVNQKNYSQLRDAARALRQRGAKAVVLLGPPLHYSRDVKELIEANPNSSPERLQEIFDGALKQEAFKVDPVLAKLARSADVAYISQVKLRCPQLAPRGCVHFLGREGDPLTRDNIHLSMGGGVWLMGQIEQTQQAPWSTWFRQDATPRRKTARKTAPKTAPPG